nr:venom polypeptide precursor [Doratifera vulnerans]
MLHKKISNLIMCAVLMGAAYSSPNLDAYSGVWIPVYYFSEVIVHPVFENATITYVGTTSCVCDGEQQTNFVVKEALKPTGVAYYTVIEVNEANKVRKALDSKCEGERCDLRRIVLRQSPGKDYFLSHDKMQTILYARNEFSDAELLQIISGAKDLVNIKHSEKLEPNTRLLVN